MTKLSQRNNLKFEQSGSQWSIVKLLNRTWLGSAVREIKSEKLVMTSMNYNLRTRTDAVGVRVLSIPCQQDKNCCSVSKSKFFSRHRSFPFRLFCLVSSIRPTRRTSWKDFQVKYWNKNKPATVVLVCPPDTIPKKMHLSLSLKGNWYIPSDIYDNRKSSSFSILSSRACVQMPHVSRSQHGKESFNQLPQMAFQWWHLNHVEKLTTSSSIHQQRDTELAQVGHSTGRQWLAPLSRIHKSQTVAETFRNKQ